MSEDKSENPKKNSDPDIDKLTQNAQDWVEKLLIPVIKPIAKYSFGLGSSAAFLSFLHEQKWLMALLTFPVTIATVIWTKYSDGFVTRFGEIYAERGKQDVDSLMKTKLPEKLRQK